MGAFCFTFCVKNAEFGAGQSFAELNFSLILFEIYEHIIADSGKWIFVFHYSKMEGISIFGGPIGMVF